VGVYQADFEKNISMGASQPKFETLPPPLPPSSLDGDTLCDKHTQAKIYNIQTKIYHTQTDIYIYKTQNRTLETVNSNSKMLYLSIPTLVIVCILLLMNVINKR